MRWLTLVRCTCIIAISLTLLPAVQAELTPADKSFETARQLMKVGNDQQAVAEFEKFLASYPKDFRLPQAAFLLGGAYQRQRNYTKALTMYNLVVNKATAPALLSLRADAYFQLGECLRETKEYDKASKAYATCLQLYEKIAPAPDAAQQKIRIDITATAQYWLAEILYQTGHEAEALQGYQAVTVNASAHPLAPWAWYSIGMIHLQHKRYAQAVTALQEVATKYATSEVAGEASLALGLACCGQALATTDLQLQQKNADQAITLLTRVITGDKVTNTSKIQAALALGGLEATLQDIPHATANYTMALSLADSTSRQAAEIRLQRAHTYYNAAMYAEAAPDYALLAESPRFADLAAEANFWLGNCQYQLALATNNVANYSSAISSLTQFLTATGNKDAKASRAAFLRGVCYEELANRGDATLRDKATISYTQVLQQWPGTDQAAQARNGLTRLARSLTPEQIKLMVGTLPAGTLTWDMTLELVQKEFTTGNYEKAITAAKQVLAGKPNPEVTDQATYLIAVSLQKLTRSDEAVTYYRQLISANAAGPLVPLAWRGLVQAYLDGAKPKYSAARDAALQLVKQPFFAGSAAEKTQEQAERLVFLAAAYLGANQQAEALTTLQLLVSEHPDSTMTPNAMLNMAWIAEAQHNIILANATYQDFIVKFPDHEAVPEACFRMGINYSSGKEYAKAISVFQNIPETSKFADQANYAIAWAYWDQHDLVKANAQFQLIAEKFPQSPLAADSLYHLGENKLVEKEYSEAMRYFSRALDLSKDAQLSALIAYELGTSAFLAEQYPLAATSFGRVLGNAPTSALAGPSLFWRAQALEKQGEKQATPARDAYVEYVKQYPQGEFCADAAVGTGRAALLAKQYEVARTDLTNASTLCAKLETAPNAQIAERAKGLAGEMQYLRAQSYFEEKNYTKALSEFAAVSAYKYEPWYTRSYLQMARCSALTGDKAGATSTLQILLRVAPSSEAAKAVPDVATELELKL